MQIKGYKVIWKVGEVGNLKEEEKLFLGNSPLTQRSEAIAFADSISRVIYEGIKEGQLSYKTSLPLSEFHKQSVFPFVCVIFSEENKEDSFLEIRGEIPQILLDNLEEELDCYDDNGYDTDGPTYALNASKYYHGYVRLLKDDYEAFKDDFLLEDN